MGFCGGLTRVEFVPAISIARRRDFGSPHASLLRANFRAPRPAVCLPAPRRPNSGRTRSLRSPLGCYALKSLAIRAGEPPTAVTSTLKTCSTSAASSHRRFFAGFLSSDGCKRISTSVVRVNGEASEAGRGRGRGRADGRTDRRRRRVLRGRPCQSAAFDLVKYIRFFVPFPPLS